MDSSEGRRRNDVLDAILDKVTEAPQPSGPTNVLFRAKALEQLDVAGEVDTRLPLVSRRSWLALVGVGLLVAAFALWASLTPSVTSISAQGRIMSAPGAVEVVAPVTGMVDSIVSSGVVRPGIPVAVISGETGRTDVVTSARGSAWQQFVVPGEFVQAGQPLMSVLPPDSASSALLVVPETQAAAIAPGMTVQVNSQGAGNGTVSTLSAPISAQLAGQRMGLVLPADTTYVLVGVDLQRPAQPGAPAAANVVLSEGTVLTRLLGRS